MMGSSHVRTTGGPGNVKEDALEVTRRGIAKEPRNVAIYLIRHLRGDSLEDIGRDFQVAKYSSVSNVVERIKALIAKDRKLRRRLEELRIK